MTGEIPNPTDVPSPTEARLAKYVDVASRFLAYVAIVSEDDNAQRPDGVRQFDLIDNGEAFISESTYIRTAQRTMKPIEFVGRAWRTLYDVSKNMARLRAFEETRAKKLAPGDKLRLNSAVSDITFREPGEGEVPYSERLLSLTSLARAIEDNSLRKGHNNLVRMGATAYWAEIIHYFTPDELS